MDKTVYILEDRKIRVEWTILKGTSPVREDFRRALVKVFLIGNCEKYLLEAAAERGTLMIDIPEGLEPGLYSLEAIWVKNAGHPGRHDRDLCRSMKQDLFAITEFEEEATNLPEGTVVLKAKSSTATYGYDGLSSYELAVLRGEWNGTEGEWLKHQRYVSVLDGRGDSEVDTMSQKSITEELVKHDTAIEDTNKEIDTAQTDIKNLNDEMEEVQDRLAYIPKESFLSSEPACDYHTEDNQDELTVSRAIKDRFGRIIDEHYVTRETVKDYTQEVVDGSKLEIQPGSVQPEDLSPAVQQMIESAAAQPGHITNLPDEEDLTVTEHNTLQFKDREYNPYNYSGMGKVYLRKHIVNGTNMLTQHMMTKPNTIYVIRYDYCLAGETIEVPEGCVLEFAGGSLRNGTIVGDKTSIAGKLNYSIFNNCDISNFAFEYLDIRWFGAIENEDCSDAMQRTINVYNKHILTPIYIVENYKLNSTINCPNGFIFCSGFSNSSLRELRLEPGEAVNKPTITVADGITAFYIENYGSGSTPAQDAVFSILGLTFVATSKTSILVNYRCGGWPSGFFRIEYSTFNYFDKVFYFTGGSAVAGTVTAYMALIGCNMDDNNYAIYDKNEDESVAESSHTMLEINRCKFTRTRLYLVGLYGDNIIKYSSFEGHDQEYDTDPIIYIRERTGTVTLEGLYLEDISGSIIIEGTNTNRKDFYSCVNIQENYYAWDSYANPKLHWTFRNLKITHIPCNLPTNNLKFYRCSMEDDNLFRSNYGALTMNNIESVELENEDSYKSVLISGTNYKYITADDKNLYTGVLAIDSIFYISSAFVYNEIHSHVLSSNVTTSGITANLKENRSSTLEKGNTYYFIMFKTLGIVSMELYDGEDLVVTMETCYAAGNQIIAYTPKVTINNPKMILKRVDSLSVSIYVSSIMVILYRSSSTVTLDGLNLALSKNGNKDRATSGSTTNRPVISQYNDYGFQYYDTTLRRPTWWNGTSWTTPEGYNIDDRLYGTTSNRPKDPLTSFVYFDTTLNKPIWWTGSKWVDATGAEV